MLELLAAPCLEHDGLGLLEARLRLGVVEPVALIVVDVVGGAASQPDDQPSFADVVDQRQLLGHADRMMQRHLRHREADLRPLRRHRQRRPRSSPDRHRRRCRRNGVRRARSRRSPAHRSAAPRASVSSITWPSSRGITAFRKQEIAELHARTPRQASGATPTYLNWCTTSPIGWLRVILHLEDRHDLSTSYRRWHRTRCRPAGS